jgi:eukaryotic-like serine/threonine-protein kinase
MQFLRDTAMMNERDIFTAALQHDGQAARAAYLDQACGSDAALRKRVEILLQVYDQAGSFLEGPLPKPNGTIDYQPIAERPGTRVGPYRLMEQIGEGGFGLVFVAEQQEPVRRKVALKVIKPGMDTREVMARFSAERQALALMDHPNIARVFDAGATESGRPYFVMELVRGIPITEYCDQHQLAPRDRLDLFITVCQAVQHAHQKGIIHRDIKPSNILVTSHDGKPVAKVIDFGVAKAINQQLSERTVYTQFAQMIGTPLYMSPEQAEMSGLDIDTRSDIYSLGVLLYELLTGSTPFDKQRFAKAAYDEIRRVIREEEPQKPSTRLSTSQAVASISAQRHMEPAKLTRLIRGELDWITMKALEKDRTRRYETANGLARDVQRYLADEPVEAGPPSMGYRARKFIRRHKGRVIAVGLLLATLLAGITASTIGFANASRNARIAATATEKANDDAARATAEAQNARAAQDQAEYEAHVANLVAADASLLAHEPLRLRTRLDACPERLRNWEWRYLNARADQSLVVLRGHEAKVVTAAFSPSGERIVTTSDDKSARVWDIRSGQELAVLRGHGDAVVWARFNPSGDRIVTASLDKTARLWDAATGKELAVLNGHEGKLRFAAFSPSGQHIVTASDDKTARLWETATGKALVILRGHEHFVVSAAFSPSGDRVVTASFDKTARMWEAVTGKEVADLRGHEQFVGTATFDSAGKRVATTSDDKTARLWNAATGQELAVLRGHDDRIWSAAFSPLGDKLVTASPDKTARLWDAATGQELAVLRGHDAMLNTASFSPSGDRVVTASFDKTARLWDAVTGKELAVFIGHESAVGSATFNPAGDRVVTTSFDKTARIWDTATTKDFSVLRGHEQKVAYATFSPSGDRIVSASDDKTARIWDAATGKTLAVLRGHELFVTSAAFSPLGDRVVTASGDKTARLWDTATGKELAVFPHEQAVRSASFNTSGDRIVTASDDKAARVWDAAEGKELTVLRGHELAVTFAAFNQVGDRIITASWDKTLRIWDASTGKQLDMVSAHESSIGFPTFSPSRECFISALADRTARKWDTATGKELVIFRGHEKMIWHVSFSPSADRVVTASPDMTARVWDPATGKELAVLRAHEATVRSAIFSPTGDRIVTTSEDNTVRVWDTLSYRERFPAIMAARVADSAMREQIAGRFRAGESPDQVAQSLVADRSLNEYYRRAGLVLVSEQRESRFRESQRSKDAAAWKVVANAESTPEAVAAALDQARRTSALASSDPRITTTYGVALYRAGKFDEAIATLTYAEEQLADAEQGPHPTDWAFLAMAQWKLRKADDARLSLARLRQLMNDPKKPASNEEREFLREAEMLINPKN